MNATHSGACNCGSVRFKTNGQLQDVVYCHCSQCRKQTGLYYAVTNVALAEIAIEGEDAITWYRASPSARRGFCRTCGSALFWHADGADHLSIMAGLFDTPTDLRVGYHIYCADKGDFYQIEDGSPQYPQDIPADPAV